MVKVVLANHCSHATAQVLGLIKTGLEGALLYFYLFILSLRIIDGRPTLLVGIVFLKKALMYVLTSALAPSAPVRCRLAV